jgi:hypothetical protein
MTTRAGGMLFANVLTACANTAEQRSVGSFLTRSNHSSSFEKLTWNLKAAVSGGKMLPPKERSEYHFQLTVSMS